MGGKTIQLKIGILRMNYFKLEIYKIEVVIHRKSITLLLILLTLERHNHSGYLFREMYKIMPTRKNYLALGMMLEAAALNDAIGGYYCMVHK